MPTAWKGMHQHFRQEFKSWKWNCAKVVLTKMIVESVSLCPECVSLLPVTLISMEQTGGREGAVRQKIRTKTLLGLF